MNVKLAVQTLSKSVGKEVMLLNSINTANAFLTYTFIMNSAIFFNIMNGQDVIFKSETTS